MMTNQRYYAIATYLPLKKIFNNHNNLAILRIKIGMKNGKQLDKKEEKRKTDYNFSSFLLEIRNKKARSNPKLSRFATLVLAL